MMKTFPNLDALAASATQQIRIRGLSEETARLPEFDLSLQVLDVVDGRYVLRPLIRYERDGAVAKGTIDSNEDIPIEISGGAASVEIDRYSGNVIVTPKGDETVFARAQIRTTLDDRKVLLSSTIKEVGISTDSLPQAESDMVLAGGGACAARWVKGVVLAFDVQVRASIMANVMPKSLTRREILWRHGRYFAFDPNIGFMSLYYDPERISRIRMETKDSERATAKEGFFPASATNEIYFICDFIDLGISAFTKVPMRQTIDDTVWPPFKNKVLEIDEPLDFYEIGAPDTLVMQLTKQEMYLYDYSSIDVELLDKRFISDGILVSRWRLKNQVDEIVYARWFMLGDLDRETNLPFEGNRLLGPANSEESEFILVVTTQSEPSSLRQRISLNVVSVRDPIVAGASSFDFFYPEE